MPASLSSRSRTHAVAALLATTAGLLLVATWSAAAADKNVTIVTGGNYPLSCDDASYAYSPIEVSVAPGDTVTFTNPGTASNSHPCAPADHPTRCAPETNFGKTKGDCPFSNFGLQTGGSHTQPFPSEGTFQLQCLAHPYMLMTVVVGDGEPGPDPEPTQPGPEPTETEPGPEPTQPGPEPTRDPTGSPSAGASPTTGPTTAPTSASEAPTESDSTPTEAATDPLATDTIDSGGSSSARGPLLIIGTALLGMSVALFVGSGGLDELRSRGR